MTAASAGRRPVFFPVAPFPEQYTRWRQEGINLLVCHQRIGETPMLAGLKTLNRLEQVMLKSELVSRDAVEGIVLNSRGFLIEGVSANLFWRRGKTVFTPDLARGGVDGIMRRQVMAMLKQMSIELRGGRGSAGVHYGRRKRCGSPIP